MFMISGALSAARACAYHAEDFRNARDHEHAHAVDNTAGSEIAPTWHGRLAERWGLRGEVREEEFQRLAEGQHPITGEQLVRHQASRRWIDAQGRTVTTMEHVACWDATVSAPKSVSLTALVGSDARVREAHRDSVSVALDEAERYVQGPKGRQPQPTGNWIAARFEHDSARPVAGYAAPHLHTHVVVFNVTETKDRRICVLERGEILREQRYLTAIYRSELAARLTALGYDIERGQSGQPEVRGYTQEYLAASSPRRRQIQELLERRHKQGAEAGVIVAHETRETKVEPTPVEGQHRHQEMATAFGDQPARVVLSAQLRADHRDHHTPAISSNAAVTFAKERLGERVAAIREGDLLREALTRSMGAVTFGDIRTAFDRRVEAGEFVAVARPPHLPGRSFTTREMIETEQDTIQWMRAGQHSHLPLVSHVTAERLEREHPQLSGRQCRVVRQILASRDQILALEGVQAAGKMTVLAAVRDEVERTGRNVEGLAPTSRAAQELSEAGIASGTLRHLMGAAETRRGEAPHLYVLDASNLDKAKEVNQFLRGLAPADRVLLVGNEHRHDAGLTGRPYERLQDAGMETARLDDIVRRKDPALRGAVERLARGDVAGAMAQLETQGRVHQIRDPDARIQAIAREYAKHPTGTLVVCPEDRSRAQINGVIRRAMRHMGQVDRHDHVVPVLEARHAETVRVFAAGDRVQFTATDRQRRVANGELATIEQIDADGLRLGLDSGRTVSFATGPPIHLDYGYAVSSDRNHGRSVDRVLVHVAAGRAPDETLNHRFACVAALSRGRYDAQIYTDDQAQLARTLTRGASQQPRIETARTLHAPAQTIARSPSHAIER